MKPMTVIPVALVDNYTMVRKGISNIINASGSFKVIMEVATGKELIEKLHQEKLQPGICILNIDMTAMDGYDTLIMLKSTWPELKVMILSVFNDPLIIQKAVQDGAVGYLQKNCEPKDLVNALMSIHTKGFYDSIYFNAYLLDASRHPQHSLAFTEKEKQLLRHVDTDMSYAQIAKIMGTSTRSVQGYRDRLFSKLHVNSRAALVRYAIKLGIVHLS